MSIISVTRSATIAEIIAENDRRGEVIKSLEAEVYGLRMALTLSDADRRLWFISDCLGKYGYFNRSDICNAFGVSVPQASIDIKKWLEAHPNAAIYSTSRKRYERAPLAADRREHAGAANV